ncbi:uncharacterized protein TM35_000361540 [Trypanosoma theileri]|uniref:Uncharacterized protein n=1 Tax=Trypanosoma theileri TaxID=67003 RepID=A0A1X0NKK3_9TRYP|nr:uncharacterized protein TM35_000361540 [Trypanosoma theileri]ORC85294.1 hypothetical protein TM35_000361540 [Trypanosoma theileri]
MSWSYYDNYPERSTIGNTEPTGNQTKDSNIRNERSSWGGGGGVGSNSVDGLQKFLNRGIYLRPNVFMINGTATDLMGSLYMMNTTVPSNIAFSSFSSSSSSSPGTNTTTMMVTPPSFLRGYKRSDTPTCWVSFNYELRLGSSEYFSLGEEARAALLSEEFTEDELVHDSLLTRQGNTADVLQYQAIAMQLSISLRENRLSTLFREEWCRIKDRPEESRHISTFLGSVGDYLGFGSVLMSGVEVALRAMQPGKTSEFLIIDSNLEFENADNINELRPTTRSSVLQCVYIKIELLHRIPHEYILPVIFQKYIVQLPSSTTTEDTETTTTTNITTTTTTTNSMIRDRAGAHARLFRFFPSTLFSKSTNPNLPQSLTSVHALRAFFMAILSVAANCCVGNSSSSLTPLRDGRPSGKLARLCDSLGHPFKGIYSDAGNVRNTSNDNHTSSTGSVNGPLTEADAKMFVYLNFLKSPSDGATVNCKIIRNGELMGNPLPPLELKDVLLGSMAMPLWLDMLLQTMRNGEEDVMNLSMKGESDAEFHSSFVEEIRNTVIQHVNYIKSGKTSSSVRHDDEDEDDSHHQYHHYHHQGEPKQHQQQSRMTSSDMLAQENFIFPDNVNVSISDRSKHEGEHNPLFTYNFSCHVVLEDFKNAYDLNAFFFVNPESSLRVVQKLENEVLALSRAEDIMYKNGNCCRDFIPENEDILPCVTAKMIHIQPAALGHNTHCFVERSVVKAIHKMNFAILLLTFYVHEENMLAQRILTTTLSQQRRVALARAFYFLGNIYLQLQHEGVYSLAVEAYSAAIEILPDDEQLRLRRGDLLREFHRDAAVHDFEVARSILQMKLQRYNTQQTTSSSSNSSSGAAGVVVSGGESGGVHRDDREREHLWRLLQGVEHSINVLRGSGGPPNVH